MYILDHMHGIGYTCGMIQAVGFIASNGPEHIIHRHAGVYEFHYITKGTGVFIHGEHGFRLESGELYCSPPGFPHGFTLSLGERIAFYYLQLNADHIEIELREALHHHDVYQPIKLPGDYRLFFEGIRRQSSADTSFLRLGTMHRFLAFLYETLSPSTTSTPMETAHPAIGKALAFLQGRVCTRTTLQDVADYIGLSPEYFARIFTKALRISPMKYLMQARIDTARYLLTSTDATLATIASQLAFTDEFHFSKTFKRINGLTPSVYRQQHMSVE